jgi:hypothetical protein
VPVLSAAPSAGIVPVPLPTAVPVPLPIAVPVIPTLREGKSGCATLVIEDSSCRAEAAVCRCGCLPGWRVGCGMSGRPGGWAAPPVCGDLLADIERERKR